MKLLDLYCGAGGAAMGYYRAGFSEITGVDIHPMPNYPFGFIQADAIEYLLDHGRKYDAIHASPPCQRFSAMQHMHSNQDEHPDLIGPTRQALLQIGKPYIIENVIGAPLRIDLMLCGTMFGLRLAHHRIFESSIPMPVLVPTCNHINLYDRFHGGEMARGEKEKMSKAMGISWFMTRPEVRNAIPPAYTEFIGRQLLKYINNGSKTI